METKWKIAETGEQLADDLFVHRVFSISNVEKAPANGYGSTPEEAKANAQLIAASPETKKQRDELLAACEDVANLSCIFMVCESLQKTGTSQALGLVLVLEGLQRQCEQVIAKAEKG